MLPMPARRLAASILFVAAWLGGAAPALAQAQADADTLRGIVAAAHHPGLKQPNFADFQATAERFYDPTGYAPAWLDGLQPRRQSLQVVEILRAAGSHGLNPEDYDVQWIAARLEAAAVLTPQERAELDAAISVSLFRYLSDVRMGRVDPRNLQFKFDLALKKYDLATLVRDALAADNLPQAAAAAAPQVPMYEILRRALPHYRRLAADTSLKPLPVVPKLEPGMSYSGTAALQRLLVAVGDMQPAAKAPPRYDGQLVEAVKRFQARHGLAADGVIGKGTFAALNTPMSWRVRQIVLSLERMRWLPPFDAKRLIGVNIPEFALRAFDLGPDGMRTRFRMKVIVGKAVDTTRTPVFVEDMRHIEFSPFWNVPPSIAGEEVLPKLRRDPGYLAKEGMEFVSTNGSRTISTAVTPENLAAVSRGQMRIRQRPGNRNPLGDIKFVLPNNMNIYLHHTSSVRLFQRPRRDFSHGCIRVEDPVRLALFVLEDQPDWTEERIRKAMEGDKMRSLRLATPVPVMIFYLTVTAEDDGRVLFLPDIYDHDRTLDQVLRSGHPRPV